MGLTPARTVRWIKLALLALPLFTAAGGGIAYVVSLSRDPTQPYLEGISSASVLYTPEERMPAAAVPSPPTSPGTTATANASPSVNVEVSPNFNFPTGAATPAESAQQLAPKGPQPDDIAASFSRDGRDLARQMVYPICAFARTLRDLLQMKTSEGQRASLETVATEFDHFAAKVNAMDTTLRQNLRGNNSAQADDSRETVLALQRAMQMMGQAVYSAQSSISGDFSPRFARGLVHESAALAVAAAAELQSDPPAVFAKCIAPLAPEYEDLLEPITTRAADLGAHWEESVYMVAPASAAPDHEESEVETSANVSAPPSVTAPADINISATRTAAGNLFGH
ncbi:hypothetical protein [Dongia sedimenti]|uniref:DUF5667 domain-containing protein n=1 Tax=Dongia sedimenti TaxID=3064282 RepID=A0ABU0YSG4_9PROT|nr:hypothetical protein [Rhodospirillaceae bacterium R-7]